MDSRARTSSDGRGVISQAGGLLGRLRRLPDKRHPGDLEGRPAGCGAHGLDADACTFHNKLRRGPSPEYWQLRPSPRGQRSQASLRIVLGGCAPGGSRRDPQQPLRCRLRIPFQRRRRVGVQGATFASALGGKSQ